MKLPQYARTITESEFNNIQWGVQPKNGYIEHAGQKFNFREANYSDFQEFTQPGVSGPGTTQDFALLMPEVLNRQIYTFIQDNLITENFVPTIKINGPVETWMREYGFEATEVAQADEVPAAQLSYDRVFMQIIKVGIRPELSYELMADAQWDIMARHVMQCGLAMARYRDLHILDIYNNAVPDGKNDVGMHYSDHIIDGGGALNWDAIVNAYSILGLENLTATDMIMNPYQAAELLKLKEFRDSSGAFQVLSGRIENTLQTGRLAPILGMNTWVSRHQPAGQVLFIDRNNYGVLGMRQPILVESDKDIVKQLNTIVFTERYGCGIMNSSGAVLVNNLKEGL